MRARRTASRSVRLGSMRQKLDVGQILRRVFQLYGQQLGVLLPAALIVFLPIAIINGAIGQGGQGTSGGAILLTLVAAAIAFVGGFWYQGVVVEAVRDILDGKRDLSLADLFRSVTPVLGALILAGILGGLGIAVGLLLLVVPGLVLLTWWALLAPVIVVERVGVGTAFGRSRELVRGNGWQVFGVIVVLAILQAVVSAFFGALASGYSDDSGLAAGLASLLGSALVAPLSALAASIMYFQLKGTGDRPAPVEQPATDEPPPPA